jgi:hypothetical protein
MHSHDAITELRWTEDGKNEVQQTSRNGMYEWVKGGGKAYVRDRANDVAFLRTRESVYGTKYVQTYADGIWNDNLLALPRY